MNCPQHHRWLFKRRKCSALLGDPGLKMTNPSENES